MGNLKIIFTNRFLEKFPPVVFHKLHLGKLLSEILAMNTEYWRQKNIKLYQT